MKNKICEFKKNIAHVRLLQTFLTVELVVVFMEGEPIIQFFPRFVWM